MSKCHIVGNLMHWLTFFFKCKQQTQKLHTCISIYSHTAFKEPLLNKRQDIRAMLTRVLAQEENDSVQMSEIVCVFRAATSYLLLILFHFSNKSAVHQADTSDLLLAPCTSQIGQMSLISSNCLGWLQHNSKPCLKPPLKKNKKIGIQYRLSIKAGQKYCRMLQREHSAILSTFIKLPFSIRPLL